MDSSTRRASKIRHFLGEHTPSQTLSAGKPRLSLGEQFSTSISAHFLTLSHHQTGHRAVTHYAQSPCKIRTSGSKSWGWGGRAGCGPKKNKNKEKRRVGEDELKLTCLVTKKKKKIAFFLGIRSPVKESVTPVWKKKNSKKRRKNTNHFEKERERRKTTLFFFRGGRRTC